MKVFRKNKHIFFTGIGGIGMSGIAEICLNAGFKVSGSDRELSDITQYLSDHGAIIYSGHNANNLQDVDLLVYSSAISPDNVERQEAAKRQIPTIRRAEMLAEVMYTKYGIAIAGTHGKTTTTSMCSDIFIKAKLDPTVVVGGRLKRLRTNARLGKGDFFISEADEYDRSFLALTPTFAVITSIDADHLDCYRDLNDIKESFVKFANKVPFFGSVICCNDDTVVQEILPKIRNTIITYGLNETAQYRAKIKQMAGIHSQFDVLYQGEKIGSINLPLPGKHNIRNALAGIATAMEVKIPFETVKPALENYKGVERRFEIKAEIAGITIVDDYAHHPTEVKATMESARQIADNRTIVIFQPHLYSRTRDFYQEFAHELSACHLLIITDIYPAREKPLAGVTSELIVHEVQKMKTTLVRYMSDINDILNYLADEVNRGDLVLFLGAGSITKYADMFTDRLKKLIAKN